MIHPVEAARVAHAVRICQLIPTIVTLYDHLITFDRELELVWKRPQTLAKTLFLWNRYFGSLFLLTNVLVFSLPPSHENLYVPFCRRFLTWYAQCRWLPEINEIGRFWLIFQAWGMAIIVWSMQSTVLFCTCAMYPHSSNIRTAAFISFVCEVASMAIILILVSIKLEASNSSLSGGIFCIANYIPSFFYAFWIPVIVVDCIYSALALWVFLRRRERGLRSMATSNTVLETLARDSLAYFFVTILSYVASIVVWVVLPASWIGLPQAFSIAGTSIMGVKLAFNLRGVYYCHSISIKSDGRMSVVTEEPEFINELPGAVSIESDVFSAVSESRRDEINSRS